MRWVFWSLIVLGLTSPALADDFCILRGAQTVGPATYTRWSGFYFGGAVSFQSATTDFSNSTPPLVHYSLRSTTLEATVQPSSIPVLGQASDSAFGGGIFLGYNTQWQDAVLSVEATYAHTNLSMTAPASPVARIFPAVNNEVALSASGHLSLTDYGEARARAGYVVGNLLPYGFIGMAVGRGNYNVSTAADVTQSSSPTPPPNYSCAGTGISTGATCQDFLFLNSAGQSNALLWGYTVGAGLDWALTPNLFLRGEFEFVQFVPVASIAVSFVDARVGAGFKF